MKFSYKTKILLLLITVIYKVTNAQQLTLQNVVDNINAEFQLELNILINFNYNGDIESYESILSSSSKPLILYNNADASVTPIYEQQPKNLLAIVWLNDFALMDDTIKFLDRLLWKLHWKDILFIVDHNQPQLHLDLFQQCWSKGFINVLVWTQDLLYTYHPYPELQVVQLLNVEAYKNKNHLRNLQGNKVYVPFRQTSPHCLSYRNRQGDLKLAGYWYKLIEIFIKQYNGTIDIDFLTVEETQNQQDIMKLVKTKRFDFIPAHMHFSDQYASSDVFCLSKVLVMCAMPTEIAKSLYLVKPFDVNIWLLCFLVFILLWLLLAFKYKLLQNHWDMFGCCMETLTISNHRISHYARRHRILLYVLHVVPFLAGFLLSNFYNCNLSSMLTAKIYERSFTILEDIFESNKKLLEFALEIHHTLTLESVPDNIKSSLTTIDSEHKHREVLRELNVTGYNVALPDDFIDFLFYQQKFLARPIAQVLKEPLYIRPYFIAMPLRSPYLEAFNRYLKYVQENGLYAKLKEDVKMDGIIGKDLEFFVDQNAYQALSLSYFCGAFVLLGIGLLCSLVVYVLEIYFSSRKLIKTKTRSICEK